MAEIITEIVSGVPIRITTVYPETVFTLSNGVNITTLFWEGAEIAKIELLVASGGITTYG